MSCFYNFEVEQNEHFRQETLVTAKGVLLGPTNLEKLDFNPKVFHVKLVLFKKQKICFIQKMKICCHPGVKFTLENFVYGARTNEIKYLETQWDRYSSVVHFLF